MSRLNLIETSVSYCVENKVLITFSHTHIHTHTQADQLLTGRLFHEHTQFISSIFIKSIHQEYYIFAK